MAEYHKLTDIEKLQLENNQLKIEALQRVGADLMQERQNVIKNVGVRLGIDLSGWEINIQEGIVRKKAEESNLVVTPVPMANEEVEESCESK